MKYSFSIILVLIFWGTVFGEKSPEVSKIRGYYYTVVKMIKNGELKRRETRKEYPVIPGIGTPVSKIIIYYDMKHIKETEYDYRVRKIENYYQHAGNVLYEEWVYLPTKEMIFYHGKKGIGNIDEPSGVEWSYTERYYFRNRKPLKVMVNGKAQKLTPGILKKSKKRLRQGGVLLKSTNGPGIPEPVLFLD